MKTSGSISNRIIYQGQSSLPPESAPPVTKMIELIGSEMTGIHNEYLFVIEAPLLRMIYF
jgi:hypothetical protein